MYCILEPYATLTRMACVSTGLRATMFAAVEQCCSMCTNQEVFNVYQVADGDSEWECVDHAFVIDPQRRLVFGLYRSYPVGVCFSDHAIDELLIALFFF